MFKICDDREYDTLLPEANNRPHLSLANVPGEIFLLITSFLRPQDIFSLRTTCKLFLAHTKDKALWTTLIRAQGELLPIPEYCRAWTTIPVEMSLAALELLAQTIQHTKTFWRRQRTVLGYLSLQIHHPNAAEEWGLTPDRARNLLSLDIFLDRWVVAVFHEAVIELWDLCAHLGRKTIHVGGTWDPHSRDFMCRARKRLPHMATITSYVGEFDESRSSIVVCISSNHKCFIIRFNLLADPGHDGAEILYEVPTPDSVHRIREINVHLDLLVLSRLRSLCLIKPRSKKTWIVQVGDGEEELWNGINGARFVSNEHIVCVKVHSVEFCTLIFRDHRGARVYPNQQERDEVEFSSIDVDIVRHSLANTTMREVSFSEPSISRSEARTILSISFVAQDLIHGLFHYRIDAHFPPRTLGSYPSGPPLSVNFTLLGCHDMTKPLDNTRLSALNHLDRSDTPTPRSGFGPNTRGYVTSSAIGKQGKRGVWIERERSSVKRIVYGFEASTIDEDGVVGGKDVELDGDILYTTENHDLRGPRNLDRPKC